MKAFGVRLTWVVGLALLIISPTPSRANLVFSISNVQGPIKGLGSFEVDLTNPLVSTSSSDVASFSIQLSVDPGIHFTSVSTSTVGLPYIFAGTGGASVDPTFQFSFDTFPNTAFTASDSEFTFSGITLKPGDSFALALVNYSVDIGAPAGNVPINFLSGTSLSDPDGGAIDFSTRGGQIALTMVPEPSTGTMMALGLGITLLARSRTKAIGRLLY